MSRAFNTQRGRRGRCLGHVQQRHPTGFDSPRLHTQTYSYVQIKTTSD
jgi:hypothetical protein